MKKMLCWMGIVVVLIGMPICFVAWAQQDEGMGYGGPGMMEEQGGPGMGQSQGRGPGQNWGPGRMMGRSPMMSRQVVATSDGGVVVSSDKKLIKYDKDLNIVKEVEFASDKGQSPKSSREGQGEFAGSHEE